MSCGDDTIATLERWQYLRNLRNLRKPNTSSLVSSIKLLPSVDAYMYIRKEGERAREKEERGLDIVVRTYSLFALLICFSAARVATSSAETTAWEVLRGSLWTANTRIKEALATEARSQENISHGAPTPKNPSSKLRANRSCRKFASSAAGVNKQLRFLWCP